MRTFNHAGNACAAATAGAMAYFWGPSVVFYLLAAMSIASMASMIAIPGRAIDHDLARGLHDQDPSGTSASGAGDAPSGLTVLMTCKPLLVFAIAVVFFHLANAAMLPLVGQKLALQNTNLGTSLISVCIVAAQVVMVPMAMLALERARTNGGESRCSSLPSLILPLRGFLYTLSDDPIWLVSVQTLDGVGAGIFGADLSCHRCQSDAVHRGSFNIAQGAIMTAQGIGAAVSTTLAGFVVVHAGYSAAFLILAGIAIAGALVFFFGMKETLPKDTVSASGDSTGMEKVGGLLAGLIPVR